MKTCSPNISMLTSKRIECIITPHPLETNLFDHVDKQ